MENNPMGRVVVSAKIENVVELFCAQKGLLPEDQVHRLEVPDALVDTGSSHLAMPRRLIEQLGFDEPFTNYQAMTTNGMVSRGIYGPVRLTVQNRFCNVDIAEVADDCPVLIGQVPLEQLDFVVDPKGQCLIGNPRHGGQQMIELY
jgi:predicted aspartyl protease